MIVGSDYKLGELNQTRSSRMHVPIVKWPIKGHNKQILTVHFLNQFSNSIF